MSFRPVRWAAASASPHYERLPRYAALGGAVAGLVLALTLPLGVFSGDEGVKLAQSQALVHNGWGSLALPYLGAEVDPEGRYFPIRPPFVWLQGGERYGVYSFEYTAVGAIFWAVGGLRGVLVLSWLGAALALWALATIARRLLEPLWAAAAVFAAAAGTPLLLYGTTNYEHAWACALVFSSPALLAEHEPRRGRLLASGALLGLATTIRPELFAFPLGVAGFAFVYWGWRQQALVRLTLVAAGTAAVAGLHLFANSLVFGSLHPNLRAADHPVTSWELNFAKLVAPEATGGILWVLLAALVLGLLPARRRGLTAVRTLGALVVIGFVVVAGLEAQRAVSPGLFSDTRTLIGLFSTTPLAVLGLLRSPLPERPVGDYGGALAMASVLFIAAVVAIKVPGFWGGLEMGSRYLLPAAPLLILVGAEGLVRGRYGALRPAMALGAAALLLLSVAATALNARCMATIRGHSERLVVAVESAGVEDVVAGKWAALVLSPLYLSKRIYRDDNRGVIPALHRAGKRRITAVETGMTDGKVGSVVVSKQDALGHGVTVFALATDPVVDWVEGHLASGAAILREDATPRLDPRSYQTGYRPVLGRVPTEVLTRGNWDYVLVAAATYGRFLAPDQVADGERRQIARRYEEILRWPLAAEFTAAGRGPESRVALYRVPRDEAGYRTQRRWRATDVAWVSDETIRPASPDRELTFSRRWQVAAFRGGFAAGRYEIRLLNRPKRVEAYLHVVTPDGDDLGSFRADRKVVLELPRRDTYLLRVFQEPGSSLSAVVLRPAGPGLAVSRPLPAHTP